MLRFIIQITLVNPEGGITHSYKTVDLDNSEIEKTLTQKLGPHLGDVSLIGCEVIENKT